MFIQSPSIVSQKRISLAEDQIKEEVKRFLEKNFPLMEKDLEEIVDEVAAQIPDLSKDEQETLSSYTAYCQGFEDESIPKEVEERGIDILMRYLHNFFVFPVDTFLSTLSLPEIGRSTNSWFEASAFFSVYGSIATFLAAIFGVANFLFPTCTLPQRLFATACMVVCVGTAIGRYILNRKAPVRLPYTTANLNTEARLGLIPRQYGREEIVGDLLGRIERARREKESAKILLTGESGVGKSSILQQLAREAAQTDSLRETPIYVLNMGDVVRNPIFGFAGSVLLEFILLTIGRHEAVLVLEEVHTAFSDPSSSLANYLKVRLDRMKTVHVIGITTEKEYTEHMSKDGAFTGRFSKIAVESLSDNETKAVLRRRFQEDPFFNDITEEELSALIEEAKKEERSFPAAALSKAQEWKSRVEEMRISRLGQERLQAQRSDLQSRLIHSSFRDKELIEKIRQLDEKMCALEQKRKELQKAFEKTEQIAKLYQTSIRWVTEGKGKSPKKIQACVYVKETLSQLHQESKKSLRDKCWDAVCTSRRLLNDSQKLTKEAPGETFSEVLKGSLDVLKA